MPGAQHNLRVAGAFQPRLFALDDTCPLEIAASEHNVPRMAGLKHYFDENYVYHLTSATEGRLPVFLDPNACETLVAAIDFQRPMRALVLAYAVMPDHLHLLLQPQGT